jgi:hypothetical protein
LEGQKFATELGKPVCGVGYRNRELCLSLSLSLSLCVFVCVVCVFRSIALPPTDSHQDKEPLAKRQKKNAEKKMKRRK